MKAIVYERYGSPDVMKLTEVNKPIPKEDELLIRVMATGLNAADWRMLRSDPLFVRLFAGLFKPKNKILGVDVAGVVEAVGKNVTQFQLGDAVFGDLSGSGSGGFAEYVCAPESIMVRKPENLSFAETAALPMASVTALQGLRDMGQLKAGQSVMIHGASGGVGTFAVQIAKAFGGEVTAVCSSKKAALAKKLGADYVIDYTKEDFTQNGKNYDLILAVNGSRPLKDYVNALTPTGTYIVAGGSMSQLFQALLLGPFKSKKGGKTIKDFTAKVSQKDLITITKLIADGKLFPIIDSCYPLAETAEAMHYLESGRTKGKIIITQSQP